MIIPGQIPYNSTELAEAVPIVVVVCVQLVYFPILQLSNVSSEMKIIGHGYLIEIFPPKQHH